MNFSHSYGEYILCYLLVQFQQNIRALLQSVILFPDCYVGIYIHVKFDCHLFCQEVFLRHLLFSFCYAMLLYLYVTAFIPDLKASLFACI